MTTTMTVHIIPDDATRALGKLADAELHFTDGPLAGLKLVGFGIWKHQAGNGWNVTFPARHYPEEGERRSYSLLRSMGGDRDAVTRISNLILEAYQAQIKQADDAYRLQHIAEEREGVARKMAMFGKAHA